MGIAAVNNLKIKIKNFLHDPLILFLGIIVSCQIVIRYTNVSCFQIMLSLVLTLPDDKDRSRLLGKENRKIKDIERVSGAFLTISRRNIVEIRADSEEALELAKGLIMKSLKHRRAAEVRSGQSKEVDSPLIWDLRLAVYYTYSEV